MIAQGAGAVNRLRCGCLSFPAFIGGDNGFIAPHSGRDGVAGVFNMALSSTFF